jgi:chlorobactene glucosyltransferase
LAHEICCISLLASVLFWSVLLLRTLYVIFFTPIVLRVQSPGPILPELSVLLPVRNEALRGLTQNLLSLLSQAYPSKYEVIAVDDESTDGTHDILATCLYRFGEKLRVVEGRTPPRGWIGKTFALAQAKDASTAEWLVAVDADVTYSEQTLLSTVSFALRNDLDALSLLPHVRVVGFWEKVVIPVMSWLAIMRVSPTQANRHSSHASFGYGNFILFRRRAHDEIGGFEAYKSAILEDCSIMERLKDRGFRVMVANGRELFTSRMYRNLREIFLGFGKNSFAALQFSYFRVALVLLAESLFLFLPHFIVVRDLMFHHGSSEQMLLAYFAVGGAFLTMMAIWLEMQVQIRYLPFYMLGHVIAIAIVTFSAIWSRTAAGVSWKSRAVHLDSTASSRRCA